MPRAHVALALVTALVAPAVSAHAQTPATETVKTELRAFVAELRAALKARDRAALERLYAPEFLFVHAIGPPIDREQHIAAAMAAAGGQFPAPNFDGLIVVGDVAILRQPVEGRYGLNIYSKASGRWQILHMQGTPVPSTRPAVAVPTEVVRSYAGRYQQDNGRFVTIAVEGSALTLQVDGGQKLVLSPSSPTQFSIPGGYGDITFAAAADGGVSYVIQRPNQVVIKAIKQ